MFNTPKNHLARHGEWGEKSKADKGRGDKSTSGMGQVRSPRGHWRTGENWLYSRLLCPSHHRDYEIDDDFVDCFMSWQDVTVITGRVLTWYRVHL